MSGSNGVRHGDELEKKITLTRGQELSARQAREESAGQLCGPAAWLGHGEKKRGAV